MNEALSERRMAENEVFFRQPNQKLVNDLIKLRKSANSEGHFDIAPTLKEKVGFYCECSYDKCRERIKMEVKEYKRLHKKSNQFMLLPNHLMARIEKVVIDSKDYIIVEKYNTPPRNVTKLNVID